MKTHFGFFTLALLLSFQSYSQDPFFSNTNQSLVNMNPSFAGTNGKVRDQLIYRNQNFNLSRRFLTYLNTLDFYIPKIKGGIGITAMADDVSLGTLKTSLFGLTYAQHLLVFDGKLKIIPSVQACYAQKSLDVNNLHFGDLIDPRYGIKWDNRSRIPNVNKSYLDINSGLLFIYGNLHVGVSVFHINRPDIGLMGTFKMPLFINAHASYDIHFSDRAIINISERMMSQQGKVYSQFFVNSVIRGYLIFGAGLSNYYTPCFNAGVKMETHSIQITYCASPLRTDLAPLNCWEISFSLNLRNGEQQQRLLNFESW